MLKLTDYTGSVCAPSYDPTINDANTVLLLGNGSLTNTAQGALAGATLSNNGVTLDTDGNMVFNGSSYFVHSPIPFLDVIQPFTLDICISRTEEDVRRVWCGSSSTSAEAPWSLDDGIVNDNMVGWYWIQQSVPVQPNGDFFTVSLSFNGSNFKVGWNGTIMPSLAKNTPSSTASYNFWIGKGPYNSMALGKIKFFRISNIARF